MIYRIPSGENKRVGFLVKAQVSERFPCFHGAVTPEHFHFSLSNAIIAEVL